MNRDDMDNVLRYVEVIDCEECGYNLLIKMGEQTTLDITTLAGMVVQEDGSKIVFLNCPNCEHITHFLIQYYEDEE